MRPWAEAEKAKLLKMDIEKAMDDRLAKREEQTKAEFVKQKSLQYVMDSYPDAFAKNKDGKPAGWNSNHPLTKEISMLMREPDLANRPDGLAIAADIAYGRYMRQQSSKMKQKLENTQLKNKQLQKQTLTEGGSTVDIPAAPPVKKAIDRVRQTGSVEDGALVMKEIFKSKGMLDEE